MRFPRCIATAFAAAFTAVATTSFVAAQAQVLAHYPLLVDLLDATSNNGPMSLLGYQGGLPPAPPNNGVCTNGIYYYGTGGQDVRTPVMSTLDTADFQFSVEFNITALGPGNRPVLMGGSSYRWLGIYLNAAGTVGFQHNNSNLTWSTTTLSTGVWYTGTLRSQNGTAELYIDGSLVHQFAVGTLNDGNNKNFTTNDFSNGLSFYGCIRNLMVVNHPTAVATIANLGAGGTGSAGVPTLSAANLPQLGVTLQLDATNLVPGIPLAFLTIGFSSTTSLLGPLPLNLQQLGLGAGSNLYVSADATTLFAIANGAGSFAFPVPAYTGLAGFTLYFQCFSIDAGATGGLVPSNGLGTTFGF